MTNHTERTVLNHLIDTCRDAERGFRLAAEKARAPEVKRLFGRLADQRRAYVAELLPQARRLGATARSAGTGAGSLHRAWMQIKAHVAANPDRALLLEAARGERHALAAYDDAVQDLLPPAARELVEVQDLGVRIAGRLVNRARHRSDGTGRSPATRRVKTITSRAPAVSDEERRIHARICAEYDEMPGLSLTLPQAARLFDLDTAACAHALDALVGQGILWTDGREFLGTRAARV